MAKDPSFPFYAQDYLVDTIRWTRAMQGLHVSLMAESWANGGLTDEGGKPMGLGSTDVELWLKIKHKWELKSGVWISSKLEEVRAQRVEFRQKQREKGILSGKKRTKHKPNPNNGSTVVEPIEDESENEKEDGLIKGEIRISKEILQEEIANDWQRWGKMIVDGSDQFWEQSKGRKVDQYEMDIFLSVATRNGWKMDTQQEFRTSLKGFNAKTNTNGTTQRKNTNSAELIAPDKHYGNKW